MIMGLFSTRIFLYLFAAIIIAGGGFGLYRMVTGLQQQVAFLRVQAAALQAINKTMQEDIANVEQALTSANAALGNIREQASLESQAIRNNGKPLTQVQVNQQWADMKKRLEAISAP